MIVFKHVRWCNFLSTGNVFTDIPLNQNKTTLIVGENGSGKSTILDAISFALFNKPFRKVNKPQLLNSITGRDLLVEIDFDIGRDSYMIRRGIKPTVFEIFVNGELLNQEAASRDYQELLEKAILRMNHKTFCQVVVLGSASYVPFMQLPAAQRREIIEDLLDLNIFTSMNTLLKEKASTNNQAIMMNVNDKKVIQTKIDLITEHLADMAESSENRLRDIEEAISEAEEQRMKFLSERNIIETVTSEFEVEYASAKNLEKKKNKLLATKIKIESKLDDMKKRDEFFHDTENCPTCKQNIDPDHKIRIAEESSAKQKEYEAGVVTAKNEIAEVEKQLKRMTKLREHIQSNNIELSQLQVKIENCNHTIKKLEREIEKIKEEKNTLDATKISELEAQMAELETKYTELHDDKNILAAASLILKDGGIKSKIIKQYVPIINRLINKYLSAMDFFVQFELNEQFEESIKSRFRDDFSYSSFSEGEKMRINLAVLFTWRTVSKQRNSVSTNLLIMDEVFDSSLDINGTEEFIKILNELTADTNTFIISHRTGPLYDKFEKIIRFEKISNFSKVTA
jgi:DNA repair exonuclease SbcCD ATPase subunit